MDDEIFEAVAHPHRRRVLGALYDTDDDRPLTVEDDIVDGHADPDLTYIQLNHSHLPKLADYGFVDWSPAHEEVTRGPAFERLVPLLEFLAEQDEADCPV
ncbi:hypothetical protein ACKVMT_16215 [Halobacteriales archaeon Cl-PHB]